MPAVKYEGTDVGDLDPRHIAPAHNNMRYAIARRGMSVEAFAGVLNVTPRKLNNWLNGAADDKEKFIQPRDKMNLQGCRLPTEALVFSAHVLGVSVWYLLDLTDNPDGSGAHAMTKYRDMTRISKVVKDVDKACPFLPYWEYTSERTGEKYEICTWADWLDLPDEDQGRFAKWAMKGLLGNEAVSDKDTETNLHAFQANMMEGKNFQEVVSPLRKPDGEMLVFVDALQWQRRPSLRFIHMSSQAKLNSRFKPAASAEERLELGQAREALRKFCCDGSLIDIPGDYRNPLRVIEAEMRYAQGEGKSSGKANDSAMDDFLVRADQAARAAMGTAQEEDCKKATKIREVRGW